MELRAQDLKSYLYNMQNSPELKALIRKKAHLFWYSKDSEKENLPLPVVLQFFINYTNQEDIKERIVGIEKAAAIFFEQVNKSVRVANNYDLFPGITSAFISKNMHLKQFLIETALAGF